MKIFSTEDSRKNQRIYCAVPSTCQQWQLLKYVYSFMLKWNANFNYIIIIIFPLFKSISTRIVTLKVWSPNKHGRAAKNTIENHIAGVGMAPQLLKLLLWKDKDLSSTTNPHINGSHGNTWLWFCHREAGKRIPSKGSLAK